MIPEIDVSSPNLRKPFLSSYIHFLPLQDLPNRPIPTHGLLIWTVLRPIVHIYPPGPINRQYTPAIYKVITLFAFTVLCLIPGTPAWGGNGERYWRLAKVPNSTTGCSLLKSRSDRGLLGHCVLYGHLQYKMVIWAALSQLSRPG